MPIIGLPKAVAPILLPEILGFSPQLFLDDIINSANMAVSDAVNAMEEFLQRWADQRVEKHNGKWDGTQEVEQGLIAFQTLLEYHTDVAFDFFEAWSLRNIFTFPSDLPVIVPHQAGLNLEHTLEYETELLEEIASLRRQIENVRRVIFCRSMRLTKGWIGLATKVE
jgi:kinetochore protein Mis12/MTW1